MRVVLACLAAFAASTASAQVSAPGTQAPAGTAVIAGTLVTAERGEAVRKATILLTSAPLRLTRTIATDADGRFTFSKLPAGDFTLRASKPGFIDVTYGARRVGPSVSGAPVVGTPISLRDGQLIENIRFQIPRGGVIAGAVFDEFGDPSFGTLVKAMQVVVINGERTVRPTGDSSVTDDRGMYRIPGLPPGDYLVTATSRETETQMAGVAESYRRNLMGRIAAARTAGDAARAGDLERELAALPAIVPPKVDNVPAYYPGVVDPSSAVRVPLGVSQEIGGIDIRLQAIEVGTVAGVVSSAEGPLPASQVSVMLLNPAMPAAQVGVWFREIARDGRFAFYGVVPGHYVLRARAEGPAAGSAGAIEITARKEIDVVPGAADDHVLRLERGATVSGRLDFRALKGQIDSTRFQLNLYPITLASDWEMAAPRAQVDPEGRFQFMAVVPGRYRIVIQGLPPGWSLASAKVDNRDAADHHLLVEYGKPIEGLEITFTDRVSEVAGSLTTASGSAPVGYTVIAFPADTSLWLPQSRRIVAAQAGADGRYLIRALPPGDYRVVAVLDPEPGSWFDKEWLAQQVATAATVKLTESARVTQDFRVR